MPTVAPRGPAPGWPHARSFRRPQRRRTPGTGPGHLAAGRGPGPCCRRSRLTAAGAGHRLPRLRQRRDARRWRRRDRARPRAGRCAAARHRTRHAVRGQQGAARQRQRRRRRGRLRAQPAPPGAGPARSLLAALARRGAPGRHGARLRAPAAAWPHPPVGREQFRPRRHARARRRARRRRLCGQPGALLAHPARRGVGSAALAAAAADAADGLQPHRPGRAGRPPGAAPDRRTPPRDAGAAGADRHRKDP